MKNLLVYVKTPEDKRFTALSSLEKFTYAPTLMYASLIPFSKLDKLKDWADSFQELCIKNNVQIEIRPYRMKAIYTVK